MVKFGGGLRDFGRKLTAAPINLPVSAQLELLFQVAGWLRWLPKAPVDLAFRSLPTMVIIMYFHAMHLAFATKYRDQLRKLLFLDRHVNSIAKSWDTLLALRAQVVKSQGGLADQYDTALEMGATPMAYARLYWVAQVKMPQG